MSGANLQLIWDCRSVVQAKVFLASPMYQLDTQP